ncbi:MAG: hypothetical protein RL335_1400 [Bacteroidota bacterium]
MKNIYLIFSILIFFSCKKGNQAVVTPQTTNVTPGLDIYACGYYYEYGGAPDYPSHYRAVYWKNGQYYPLSDTPMGIYSAAYGIVVAQNHIYVAGEFDKHPCYWMDGQKITLNDAYTGRAKGLVIKNGVLYIMGDMQPDPNYAYASYLWIVKSLNDVQQIELGDVLSIPYDIFTDGTDIYISGEYHYRACYWVWNGTQVQKYELTNANMNEGKAKAIAKYQLQIYTAGLFLPDVIGKYYAGFWINDSFNSSGLEPAFAQYRDMAFSPTGEMYLVGLKNTGTPGDYNAMVWKGAVFTPVQLSANYSLANKILFDGNDYYVAGSENYKACYWKNGAEIKLLMSDVNSYATDIFLVHN